MYTADVVVGADGTLTLHSHKYTEFFIDWLYVAPGVKSKARELVLGIADAPKPSGYAIFRTSYSADLIRVGHFEINKKEKKTHLPSQANPICAHLAPEGKDARTVWVGPDAHFIHGTSKSGKQIHWLLTQYGFNSVR